MSKATPVQPPFALTVSADARAVMTPMLNANAPDLSPALMNNPGTRKIIRLAATHHLKPLNRGRAKRFDVGVSKGRIGDVSVKFVRRREGVRDGDQRLLLNFHGGGFLVDSGSLTETIPIAGLTGIPVATALYRMAPEHPFPAAVDDALAVYKDALSRRPPESIGIYGTSAGAVLTLQLLARIKYEGMPMPAAAGCFSGSADLARASDCEAFLSSIRGERAGSDNLDYYTAGTDRTDPLLSPIYGDLSGLPPTMLMSSTRDQLLSQTVLADPRAAPGGRRGRSAPLRRYGACLLGVDRVPRDRGGVGRAGRLLYQASRTMNQPVRPPAPHGAQCRS